MKVRYYIIAAMSGALVLTSCNSSADDFSKVAVSDTPITYSSGNSRVTGSSFDEGEKIAVWASHTNADGETNPFINRQIVKFEKGAWHSDDVYYWPAEGSLDFYAISPINDDIHNATKIKVTPGVRPDVVVDMPLGNGIDLLAAHTPGLKSPQKSPVKLHFKHMLCRVEFTVTNQCAYGVGLDVDLSYFDIMGNMYTSARLNWDTMEMETLGEQEPMKESLNNVFIPYQETKRVAVVYLFPQVLNNPTIKAGWKTLINGVVADSYTVSKDFTDAIQLETGKTVTINLTLTRKSDGESSGDVNISGHQ